MAVPAIRLNGCVIVTCIAEIFLAFMALHASQHQAFWILLFVYCNCSSISVTKNFIPPGIEQYHVLGTHFSSRKHAFLSVFWQLRLWWGARIALVIPDRYCDKQDEDDQSQNYLTTIVHCHSSIPTGKIRRVSSDLHPVPVSVHLQQPARYQQARSSLLPEPEVPSNQPG